MENLQTGTQNINEFYFKHNLQKGSSGDDIKDLQKQLKQLGYYMGKIDGIFGSLTNIASRDFQTDYKLVVDGVIGPITQAKIEEVISSTAVFQLGSTDVEVKTLQRQLKLLDLYPGNIDGIFGPITNSGVKKFQQNNGLVEDGKAGLDTKEALKKKMMGEEDKDIENKDEDMGFVSNIGEAIKDFLGLENEPDKDSDKKEAIEKTPAKDVVKTGGIGNTYVSKDQLKELGWVNVNDAMLKDLNNCLERYDITKPQRIRHFISQCSVESGAGKYKIEQSWNRNKTAGEAYEGRKDLGNVHPGDGPKYKGAGYIQLTGRNNYQQFADNIKDLKIMEGAEYVADKYPWTSAGFYWDREKINALCDQGASVKEITKKVNGGYNGLTERGNYYQKCTKIFK